MEQRADVQFSLPYLLPGPESRTWSRKVTRNKEVQETEVAKMDEDK